MQPHMKCSCNNDQGSAQHVCHDRLANLCDWSANTSGKKWRNKQLPTVPSATRFKATLCQWNKQRRREFQWFCSQNSWYRICFYWKSNGRNSIRRKRRYVEKERRWVILLRSLIGLYLLIMWYIVATWFVRWTLMSSKWASREQNMRTVKLYYEIYYVKECGLA